MKNNQICNLIIFTFLLIGLLLWEFWPEKNSVAYLEYNNDQSSQLEAVNCQVKDFLLDQQWEIRYPYSISKSETKTIEAALSDIFPNIDSMDIKEPECAAAVEIFLDIPGTKNNQGSRIIQPYHLGSPLEI